MRIYTKSVLDMETLQFIPELAEFYEYPDGSPLEYCDGGASGAAQANEAAQTAFYKNMTQEQQTTFGESQDILNNLKSAWSPILAAGPYAYGFSTAEDQALRADIENLGAQATTNTVAAQQLREQQQSGGADVLPTGAQAAVETEARELGAQKTAAALSQERLAGYEQGSRLFSEASGALGQTAGLENPVGTANAAIGAGQSATSAINLVDTEQANSLLNKAIGGAIGGAISGGEMLATGGLSSAMGLNTTMNIGGRA
jgi:hypothetical protein